MLELRPHLKLIVASVILSSIKFNEYALKIYNVWISMPVGGVWGIVMDMHLHSFPKCVPKNTIVSGW